MCEEKPNTVSSRIKVALEALSRYGITEDQVQVKSRFSDEQWARFTADLAGIKTVELVLLAEALMLDVTYLLNGDDRYRVRYSPCTLQAMIAAEYQLVPGTLHTLDL